MSTLLPLDEIAESGLRTDTNFRYYNRDLSAYINTGTGGFSVTGTWSVSGATTFADGTATAPSIAFTNSTGTGFYRSAADVIGVAVAGVPGLAVGGASPTLAAASNVAGQDVYVKAADGGANTGTARNGGLLSFAAGNGNAALTTAVAGAGGARTDAGGNGGSKASGTSGAAGSGGASTQIGGGGGNTAGTTTSAAGSGGPGLVAGGAGGNQTGAGASGAAGSGGSAGCTAGAGGNATGAGSTGNGGNGGSVPLQPGAGGTTTGGTAGFPGIVYVAGTAPMPLVENQSYAAMADADATLTDAQHRGGIISVAAGANNRTITTRTAAQIVLAFPGIQVGSAVPLETLNLKVANLVTMAGGAGVTAVGNMIVSFGAAAKFKILFSNVSAGTEAAQLIRVAG